MKQVNESNKKQAELQKKQSVTNPTNPQQPTPVQPQPPKTNPQQPSQPNPVQNPVVNPQGQGGKGPSQTTPPVSGGTGKIDLTNMFGTNVPTQNNPNNVTPKQNVPVQGLNNPPPKGPDSNFADIWATTTTGQTQQNKPATNNPAGLFGQPQNKPTTPTQPNPPPQGRTTTFNQLFGLGGK